MLYCQRNLCTWQTVLILLDYGISKQLRTAAGTRIGRPKKKRLLALNRSLGELGEQSLSWALYQK